MEIEWLEQKGVWKDVEGIGMVVRKSTEKGNKARIPIIILTGIYILFTKV